MVSPTTTHRIPTQHQISPLHNFTTTLSHNKIKSNIYRTRASASSKPIPKEIYSSKVKKKSGRKRRPNHAKALIQVQEDRNSHGAEWEKGVCEYEVTQVQSIGPGIEREGGSVTKIYVDSAKYDRSGGEGRKIYHTVQESRRTYHQLSLHPLNLKCHFLFADHTPRPFKLTNYHKVIFILLIRRNGETHAPQNAYKGKRLVIYKSWHRPRTLPNSKLHRLVTS